MNFEFSRLSTFAQLGRNFSSIKPPLLAREGLYVVYKERVLVCYSCGVRLNYCLKEFNAVEFHRQESPNCRHLLGQDEGNVPMTALRSEDVVGLLESDDVSTSSSRFGEFGIVIRKVLTLAEGTRVIATISASSAAAADATAASSDAATATAAADAATATPLDERSVTADEQQDDANQRQDVVRNDDIMRHVPAYNLRSSDDENVAVLVGENNGGESGAGASANLAVKGNSLIQSRPGVQEVLTENSKGARPKTKLVENVFLGAGQLSIDDAGLSHLASVNDSRSKRHVTSENVGLGGKHLTLEDVGLDEKHLALEDVGLNGEHLALEDVGLRGEHIRSVDRNRQESASASGNSRLAFSRSLDYRPSRSHKAAKVLDIDSQYSSYEARRRSYDKHPVSFDKGKHHELAMAGFHFYDNGRAYTVRSSCCGAILNRFWTRDDDPFLEHEIAFPECAYIKRALKLMLTERIAKLERTEVEHTSSIKELQESNTLLEDKNSHLANENSHLTNEISELKELRLCKVCQDKEVGETCRPCGHLACCTNCAPEFIGEPCPICRRTVLETVRTFLS